MKIYIKLLITSLTFMLFSMMINAQDFEYGGIYYRFIDDSNVEVAGYRKTDHLDGILNFPQKVTTTHPLYGETHPTVSRIADDAFYASTELISVTIPSTVISIGEGAFSSCSSLVNVEIGTGVSIIDTRAFAGCSKLTNVSIPNNVTTIGKLAFANCTSLKSIFIPKSVTNIGYWVLSGCPELESIRIANGNLKYDLGDDYNVIVDKSTNTLIAGCKKSIIPNTVIRIATNAFYESKIASVTIPNSVTTIDYWSFIYCDELEQIYMQSPIPPVANDPFSNETYSKATLYVPIGSIDKYNNADYWKLFTTIQEYAPNAFNLKVTSVSYATLFLDYNAAIPEGVEAYVATEVVDSRLKLKKVEGVIPANTGVIVVADEGTYAFVDSDEAPAVIEKNLLKGSVENTYVTAEANTSYYVLSTPDGNVGMYLAKLTDGKFLNNANKAYLPIKNGNLGIFDDEVDSGVEQLSRRLVFDFGHETNIDEVEVETEIGKGKTEIYDLSGRSVQNVQKGIYIHNGKMIVK